MGAYGQASDRLRALRALVPPDADLDLAWAIDLARSGSADSAAHILESPLLSAALRDSTNPARFHFYGWDHEGAYLDGRFDAWFWYVARARAEVNARLGRWDRALEAARICTSARPLAGIEWHLRSLCAARTGDWDEAQEAAERAVRLTPTLPEARYLQGLFEWRAGRRHPAQESFRAAIELDSTYREPAVALVRSRLPVQPDPTPIRLLNGLREAELVTSRVQPKYDEFLEIETAATVTQRADVLIPDSLSSRVKPIVVRPIVLFDEHGDVAIHEDPWAAATSAPDALVGLISSTLRKWKVTPARRLGHPQALWLELDVNVKHAGE